MNAYTIDGNNYFKLRDLMQALNIGVIWNGNLGQINIDSEKSYVPEDSGTVRPLVIPALLYHHISPVVTNSMMVTPEKFEADMLALKEAGFTTMLPKDLIEASKKNEFPENPILITFDDGYESNFQYAYPVLKENEMKATIFVIGWSIGTDVMPDGITSITPHFTIEQGKEMVESGLISIQPHSYDLHWDADYAKGISYGIGKLPGETEEQYKIRFEKDLTRIREIVETSMGDKLISYSYPYGLANNSADEILRENGIEVTFSVQNTFTYLDWGSDLFHIKRLTVTNDLSSDDLVKLIDHTKADVKIQRH